jgi:hypothetical protein
MLLTSQREKRRKAYKYILNQVKKLNLDLLCKSDKTIANVSYIPLSDIEKVKEGIADPSEELVEALKGLFHHIASEAETEDHLVKPFSNQYGRT